MKQIFLVMGVVLIGLSACQTSSDIGTGIIDFSGFEEGYDDYLKFHKKQTRGDTAFALSQLKGSYGAYVAWGGDGDSYFRAMTGAIDLCDYADCKVYAINGKVVWKNVTKTPDIKSKPPTTSR